MVEVVVQDEDADAELAGGIGSRNKGREGRQASAEVVRGDEGGEAEVLDPTGQRTPLSARGGVHRLHAEAEGTLGNIHGRTLQIRRTY